jgi:hypothetical protein
MVHNINCELFTKKKKKQRKKTKYGFQNGSTCRLHLSQARHLRDIWYRTLWFNHQIAEKKIAQPTATVKNTPPILWFINKTLHVKKKKKLSKLNNQEQPTVTVKNNRKKKKKKKKKKKNEKELQRKP